MPAAVLIMAVLGSLALDQIIVVQAQRNLVVTAQTAASQAIIAGVDIDAVRSTGAMRWNRATIDRQVRVAVHQADPQATPTWRFDGVRLTVWLHRPVALVFAPAFMSGRTRTVKARATARLPRR